MFRKLICFSLIIITNTILLGITKGIDGGWEALIVLNIAAIVFGYEEDKRT